MNRTVWLWLLVIFVGIQFGAGWYEKLAIVPLWAEASTDQVLGRRRDFARQRWPCGQHKTAV